MLLRNVIVLISFSFFFLRLWYIFLQGSRSASKAVKAAKVVNFERNAVKAAKLYIFNHLTAKAALWSNSSPNIHFCQHMLKNVFTWML